VPRGQSGLRAHLLPYHRSYSAHGIASVTYSKALLGAARVSRALFAASSGPVAQSQSGGGGSMRS